MQAGETGLKLTARRVCVCVCVCVCVFSFEYAGLKDSSRSSTLRHGERRKISASLTELQRFMFQTQHILLI